MESSSRPSDLEKISGNPAKRPKRPTVHRTLSDPTFYSPTVSILSKPLEVFAEEEDFEESGNNKENLHENVPSNLPGHQKATSETDGRLPTTAATTTSTFIADFEEDEISTGLPSDLPSDLFDIEGNPLFGNLHHLRFGLEEDDFSSADDEETQSLHKSKQGNMKGESKIFIKDQGNGRHHRNHQKSSNKFTSIPTTCHHPSPRVLGKLKLGESELPEIDTKGDTSASHLKKRDKISNSTTQHTPKDISDVRRTLQKQNSVDDLHHPLIKTVFISKSQSNTVPTTSPNNIHRPISRRQFSLAQKRTRNCNNNNNNSTNSGNFSPPSDQFRSPLAPFDRHHSSGGASSNNSNSTITQHYYPEGGWGYVVLVTCMICHVLTCGFQLSFGTFSNALLDRFGSELRLVSSWLGAVSLGISLLFSPVWVSICKKKSTRLSAVFGGLVATLGCLFTSFASQFHQTFISYGAFLGVGVGLTRDASSLMVGQYFKRKRELVEIIVVSGSGIGIIVMSIAVHSTIGSLGWRLGLQAVTVSLILTFFLGTCYRSASLYHPQRRAILHLKNQKRKVKEKGKREDRPPFIDCSCLRSKTLRIILMSSACTAFGIFTPLLSLAVQCSNPGFEDCSILLLHVYVGTSWVIGCCTLGLVVIQKSQDCRVSKQYLCQVASVICGISILALTAVKGTNGMVVFSWVYGASLGGYCYSLKVYTYERARARHFPRAWSFLQSSQAIPLFFGVPLTNYANEIVGWKSGYYMSAVAVFVGTACLFLTDVRRRKLSRRKSQNSSMKTCETTDGGTSSSPKSKRLSFAFPAEQQLAQQQSRHDTDDEDEPGGPVDPSVMIKELTCISEEGLADVDFQDIYFDEWAEYLGECITSCNKVENCLASEYDPDLAMVVDRRARRWSAAKHLPHHQLICNATTHSGPSAATTGRLTLPGIGTVLEVPLLVAKRLHPNLGVRSHHPHNYPFHPPSDQRNQPRSSGGGNPYCGSSECNYARGGNCASAGSSGGGSDSQAGFSRVHHHGRASNHPLSHFPAIDEDSV